MENADLLVKKPINTAYAGYVIDSARKWALAEFEAIKHGPLPYSVHLTAVAGIVACYTRKEDVIAAAWLHDIVEDFREQFTIDDVLHMTNHRVAHLVDLLTDPPGPRALVKQVSLQRISTDMDACLIKLADRHHNQGTAILDADNGGMKYVAMYHREFPAFRDALFPSVQHLTHMKSLMAGLVGQYVIMEELLETARREQAGSTVQ